MAGSKQDEGIVGRQLYRQGFFPRLRFRCQGRAVTSRDRNLFYAAVGATYLPAVIFVGSMYVAGGRWGGVRVEEMKGRGEGGKATHGDGNVWLRWLVMAWVIALVSTVFRWHTRNKRCRCGRWLRSR